MAGNISDEKAKGEQADANKIADFERQKQTEGFGVSKVDDFTTVAKYALETVEKTGNLVSYGEFGLDSDPDVARARLLEQFEDLGLDPEKPKTGAVASNNMYQTADGTIYKLVQGKDGEQLVALSNLGSKDEPRKLETPENTGGTGEKLWNLVTGNGYNTDKQIVLTEAQEKYNEAYGKLNELESSGSADYAYLTKTSAEVSRLEGIADKAQWEVIKEERENQGIVLEEVHDDTLLRNLVNREIINAEGGNISVQTLKTVIQMTNGGHEVSLEDGLNCVMIRNIYDLDSSISDEQKIQEKAYMKAGNGKDLFRDGFFIVDKGEDGSNQVVGYNIGRSDSHASKANGIIETGDFAGTHFDKNANNDILPGEYPIGDPRQGAGVKGRVVTVFNTEDQKSQKDSTLIPSTGKTPQSSVLIHLGPENDNSTWNWSWACNVYSDSIHLTVLPESRMFSLLY